MNAFHVVLYRNCKLVYTCSNVLPVITAASAVTSRSTVSTCPRHATGTAPATTTTWISFVELTKSCFSVLVMPDAWKLEVQIQLSRWEYYSTIESNVL